MGRLDPYIELLAAFVEQGSIDGTMFEKRFSEMFQEEETRFPEAEFLVLDKLFGDVDAFEPNAELRDEDYLDEQGLRVGAAEALAKLRDLAAIS